MLMKKLFQILILFAHDSHVSHSVWRDLNVDLKMKEVICFLK
ncbi:hypothetical protein SAMN05421780_1237 [Flexibacter flexilis DSM 6793]|uniref:Uncharacterized protein n=1 Tax=Flexibacter flexilis DSM 6793 TaxID=927664 RepID=A0A1I1NXH4_9BACT|nr:hypothetical protein SAMN05421780_1237 [Flexibacter flexilis DSM 6793]